MIVPDIIGRRHYDKTAGGAEWLPNVEPFAIGQVDPSKTYIHIFDDTSLQIVLDNRDTINDFVHYLARKERLIKSGLLLTASGEEDLLAYYLKDIDVNGEHDFIFPEGLDKAIVAEDCWTGFVSSRERQAQLKADAISYIWDDIIERFATNFRQGTLLHTSDYTYVAQAEVLRFFARETRFRRRVLSEALIEAVSKGSQNERFTRLIQPTVPGDPYYVFLTIKKRSQDTYEQYRKFRASLLHGICNIVKAKYPAALDIVGLATEPGSFNEGRSEDACYLDARVWSDEATAKALEQSEQFGLLTSTVEKRWHTQEFPQAVIQNHVRRVRTNRPRPQSLRNSPCPCGSGKKYKKCCGHQV